VACAAAARRPSAHARGRSALAIELLQQPPRLQALRRELRPEGKVQVACGRRGEVEVRAGGRGKSRSRAWRRPRPRRVDGAPPPRSPASIFSFSVRVSRAAGAPSWAIASRAAIWLLVKGEALGLFPGVWDCGGAWGAQKAPHPTRAPGFVAPSPPPPWTAPATARGGGRPPLPRPPPGVERFTLDRVTMHTWAAEIWCGGNVDEYRAAWVQGVAGMAGSLRVYGTKQPGSGGARARSGSGRAAAPLGSEARSRAVAGHVASSQDHYGERGGRRPCAREQRVARGAPGARPGAGGRARGRAPRAAAAAAVVAAGPAAAGAADAAVVAATAAAACRQSRWARQPAAGRARCGWVGERACEARGEPGVGPSAVQAASAPAGHARRAAAAAAAPMQRTCGGRAPPPRRRQMRCPARPLPPARSHAHLARCTRLPRPAP
jgi:hypothetical protein